MSFAFASVFAAEIDSYLELLSNAGRKTAAIQSALRSLDKHLVAANLRQKTLSAQIISDWQKKHTVSANTMAMYTSSVIGFEMYLASLGIDVEYPERPKQSSTYVPYIFSDVELERIFTIADNRKSSGHLKRQAIFFPVVLRVLYGCGLRLGECLSLRWKDVDLVRGILTIRTSKNLKERFVPMSASLTEILRNYRKMVWHEGICADYLFESNYGSRHGESFKRNAFYKWFMKILREAGVVYSKNNCHERGPCPHCLRHTFVLKSFLKSEHEGKRFEDTAPFLAAYLGHDSPKETEAYLRSNYTVYTQSHQRVNAAIGNLFPEVCFDEE